MFELRLGDCMDPATGLGSLANSSVDAMVTDPPAGIGFMGKEWDGDRGGRVEWIAWLRSIMQECLRVLKPGAHALVWAIPRTSHWTAAAIEEAGFEIRDVVTHHFGTGFPKSKNISKAIDAALGAEREVVGVKIDIKTGRPMSLKQARRGSSGISDGWDRPCQVTEDFQRSNISITAPATPEAAKWEGWGTALKPATEHWILARKPLADTVAANVLAHGTGGINVDACRIAGPPSVGGSKAGSDALGLVNERRMGGESESIDRSISQGRWPANLVLSHSPECMEAIDGTPRGCVPGCPVAEIDAQSGPLKSGAKRPSEGRQGDVSYGKGLGSAPSAASQGAASRFFYTAKPSTSEREEGLARLPKKSGPEITGREGGTAGIESARSGAGRSSKGRANYHPTVKSIDLMSWLIKLISPPGATILDPFAGSGTTGVAAAQLERKFVGWEREPEYHAIALERLKHATKQLTIFGGAG